MTDSHPSDATAPEEAEVNLPPVAFPETIWQTAQAQILEHPDTWEELASDGHWLADRLWAEWATPLEARGFTLELLAEVVAGYRHELWLWLMDERTWPHIQTSLAGRTLRRGPTIATTPEPAKVGQPS